jgi:hypothetical protein
MSRIGEKKIHETKEQIEERIRELRLSESVHPDNFTFLLAGMA